LSHTHHTVAPRARAADYNLRILWPLARWLERNAGADALARVTDGTGVTPEQLDGTSRWISADAFETILARARALMPDDDTFMRACAHRIKEAYGAIRYVLWAATPEAVYGQSVKTYHLVSTVGKPTSVERGRTHFHMRIEPEGRSISRLACLARQAQCAALPTLWGLPAAHVKEDACIGLGDATCELHFRWYVGRRWAPILLAAIAFVLLGLLLRRLGIGSVPMPLVLGLLGAATGYILEGRRAERANIGTREEVIDALRALAMADADARREIIALGQRQKEWTRLVEEQVRERTATLEQVVSGMQGLQQDRVSTVLGFSHDLRSPLQVLQFGAEAIRLRDDFDRDDDAKELAADMDRAIGQMKRMLGELVETARGQHALVQLHPQRLEVPELRDRLERRLRALVYGRDVRASVVGTREAPAAIEIDPLVLDRIIDNLLTNAVKYTERGSIVVELDGTPGFLVLKVSDTGRGIAPDALEGVFHAGGSTVESRARDSFGVGLSVVVQLLDQIGGRLEVMSKPAEGTTFWVRVPLSAKAPEREAKKRLARDSEDGALSRVVQIRSRPEREAQS
jgi:signal transduction histidine kinase